MITASHRTLKDLVDSKDGIHLSIYINGDVGALHLKKKLNSFIKEAESHLSEILSDKEIYLFLQPLRTYAADDSHHLLRGRKGSLGLFLKNDFFKAIEIPMPIEDIAVTADSFHIKPLIMWAQQDHEFILVGINPEGAHFYKGTQTEVKKIDQITHPVGDKSEVDFMMKWLGNWIDYLTRKTNTLVFVIADKKSCKQLSKHIRTKEALPTLFQTAFSEGKMNAKLSKIRSLIKLSSQTRVNQILKEFDLHLKMNTAKTNIFQIAKAAVKGRIRKLLVAEDFNIFGRLDKKHGGLALHPQEMNHEDDCLLDDIAQTVLLNGGEVSVVKREEMPYGRPILAVLHDNPSSVFAETHRVNRSLAL